MLQFGKSGTGSLLKGVAMAGEWCRLRIAGIFLWLALVMACIGGGAAPASAATDKLRIDIDLSSQTMRVDAGFFSRYTWRVSTARPGYRTPVGKYRPTRLERMWYSSKYENSPMPHSIFFLGGYAIHGTYEVKRLGRAVSHGCVRLHPSNASKLFSLVKSYGAKNTVITIRP
jgi:lipoprotein-anchoring transpeptidase ErfK/SrfK